MFRLYAWLWRYTAWLWSPIPTAISWSITIKGAGYKVRFRDHFKTQNLHSLKESPLRGLTPSRLEMQVYFGYFSKQAGRVEIKNCITIFFFFWCNPPQWPHYSWAYQKVSCLVSRFRCILFFPWEILYIIVFHVGV